MRPEPSRMRRAAEMYLNAGGNGRRGIPLRVCAERYGISIGAVHEAVRRLREERRRSAEVQPEDECTL